MFLLLVNYSIINYLIKVFRIKHWKKTSGNIVDARIESYNIQSGLGFKPVKFKRFYIYFYYLFYHNDILIGSQTIHLQNKNRNLIYKYVNKKEYELNHLLNNSKKQPSTKNKLLKEIQTIDVYYNPEAPSESVVFSFDEHITIRYIAFLIIQIILLAYTLI